MPDDPVNVVRIQETEQSIAALKLALTDWLDRRDKKDARGQYKTLLATLRTQLTGLIDEVRLAMKPVSASDTRGAVYAACRLNDKRLLWIERLWTYFKEKFDQREDPRYSGLLAAADEVVWSCYAEPFRSARLPHGAAPLPWIVPEYSPKAIGRARVPQDLRSDVDSEFLTAMLQELPVPVVSIPPQCVREPWWLIYLAHEVGHQVQFDLLPKEQLVDRFSALVRDSIEDDEAGERWQYRAEEIFADVFSIYTTGPWALWALTELEWTTDEAMVDDTSVRYPSPASRLMLMSAVLDRLGFDGAAARRNFPAALDDRSAERSIVAAVVESVTTKAIVDARTFPQLCAWRPGDHRGAASSVVEWVETFLRAGTREPDETLSAARLALAGGVAAWSEASTETDAKRRAAIKQNIAAKLLTALQRSHEPVERAAQASPRAATQSRTLTALLFETSPARLGAW